MKTRPFVLALAVGVLGALVFLPAIGGPWIFDDHPLIENNPYVHSLAWFSRWFTSDFWNVNEEILRFAPRMVYWRPLVTGTYAVDWTLGQGSPLMFHITNTVQQAIVGGLAFVVLRRWIGAMWPAFVAALLFAVHPTKAESVAWIAGRTDILCMIAVLVATEGIALRLGGRRAIGLALEIAGTAAAYMCKEQAIVLPAFAAVEAWIVLGRPALDRAVIRPLIRAALPQLAVAILYLAIRAAVMPIRSSMGSSPLPPFDHLLIVVESIGRFATLTFVPHEMSIQQGLVHFHNRVPVHSVSYVLIGTAWLAVLVAGAWLARKRWPVATIGIAFYLATLLPTSNVKYTEMATLISERFLYLPFFGIAFVIGAAVAAAGRYQRIAYIAVAAAILITGVQSMNRSADYTDEHAFWEREIRLHPDSYQARAFKVAAEVVAKHYHRALVELLEAERTHRLDRSKDRDIVTALVVADVTSRLVPDHDVANLRAIDAFVGDLLERREGRAELAVLDVRFSYPLHTLADFEMPSKPKLMTLRATLQSRLGDDAKAVELAGSAVASCHECVSVLGPAALVYARAGRYEEGIALLDHAKRLVNEEPIKLMQAQLRNAMGLHMEALTAQGPAQLQKKAAELAALELWGRAYDVLAPYKDQIKTAARFAPGFAELAFRAGEVAVAREIMATYTADIDAQLHTWAVTMGWAE